MFACQQKFNVLWLKNGNGIEYIISLNLEGVYNSKLNAIHGAFLTNVKYFGNKIEIQFNNTHLVIEKHNYTSRIVNVYIVSALDNWSKHLLINSALKN